MLGAVAAVRCPRERNDIVRKMKFTAIAAGATLATTGLLAAPAAAAPRVLAEVERETMGTCSAGARWDLNLEREFGVIDIGFEIDGATPGERWTVVVKRNGSQVVKVSRPADAEGEVDVDHIVRDRSGSDRFTVRATSASDQVCRAALRI
jgi:hypothetical protein